MRLKSITRLALSLLLCLGVGAVESLVIRPEIPTWYAGLVKPTWTPAPLVFPIAWSVLYVLMAISFWRLWDLETRSAARTKAMTWFPVQLALNALWSPVFFGWHGTRTALIIIIGLLVAIAATMIKASRVERLACWRHICSGSLMRPRSTPASSQLLALIWGRRAAIANGARDSPPDDQAPRIAS